LVRFRSAVVFTAFLATALSAPGVAQSIPGALPDSAAALARGEWPAYAGTYAALRYSPLDQINASNANRLRVAWRWASPDHAIKDGNPRIQPTWSNQSTPLMVGGTLYTSTSLSQVAAIDAASGATQWVFDPGVYKHGTPANNGWLHRGLAYWKSGEDERVIILTAHAYMIALEARTGKPVAGFGKEGWVDLTEGLRRRVPRSYYTMTSPPVVVRDVIVVGSSVWDHPALRDMPPGDVRGFDVRTGKPLWTFNVIPQEGEPGVETWEDGSWRTAGSANVWSIMSADEELGYVYLPTSTPSNDYYGGGRRGDNLYAESLVCIEARTGAKVWHYQIVRHGIWDYDVPAAPNLVDVTVAGRRVKAVAVVTKQGFVFAFDRTNGQPLWPVEDRPVPASSVPGERLATTQPFPTRPAPFEIQGVREEDLIDLTPELRREALEIVRKYDSGPLYTAITERGTIVMPGPAGSANWEGAAVDPETGVLYLGTRRVPYLVSVRKPRPGEAPVDYLGEFAYLPGPRGLPLFRPPWGSLVAIDLNSGKHLWRSPVGNGHRGHEAIRHLGIRERLGWAQMSWTLATKTVLLTVQSGYQSNARRWDATGRRVLDRNNLEPALMVFDKRSGALLHQVPVPQNATGSPITYMAAGKQYFVFPAGGANLAEELIAVALP